MPKEEWGVKRLCPTTGRRFYDLNKSPIVSPYTGEVVNLDGPKSRSLVSEKTASKATARNADEEIEDDVVLEDDDNEIEDELLEEDDDDDNVSLDDIADVTDGDDET